MSVECESRVAESGNALRALETRRAAVARTILQQCRFVRPNRLHSALACERCGGSCAAPGRHGKDARNFGEAFAAAICARAVRSVVRAAGKAKWSEVLPRQRTLM